MLTKILTCRVRRKTCTVYAFVAIFCLGNILFLSKFYSTTTNQDILTDANIVERETEDQIEDTRNGFIVETLSPNEDLLDIDQTLAEGKHSVEEREELNNGLMPLQGFTDTSAKNVEIIDVSTRSPLQAEATTKRILSITSLAVNDGERNVVAKVEARKDFLAERETEKMAVLVIACNRPSVGKCLDGIFKYKPAEPDIPVIVSQDCGDLATARVIQSYGSRLKHIQQPELGDVRGVPVNMMHFMGYYKISRHYKWALTQVFSDPRIGSVVIVEDDLDIAPDFFNYFRATRSLLDKDPTIFCVSAWNDNGREGFVDGVDTLYRSDFFPGLGWLLTRKIWDEFKVKWPLGFWDDWIRHPDQRKDRVCIRPEISRTRTFGRVGVSGGQFYDQYLQFIRLNADSYPFEDYDMSFLVKDAYDRTFMERVNSAPEYSPADVLEGRASKHPAVRVTYVNNGQFESLARQFGLMTDLKAGVPRTAYKGVVSFVRNNQRIYIAAKRFEGYREQG